MLIRRRLPVAKSTNKTMVTFFVTLSNVVVRLESTKKCVGRKQRSRLCHAAHTDENTKRISEEQSF